MNENVFPLIEKSLVFGVMASGESGVLLVVGGPVSTMAVPVGATWLKGNRKEIVDAAVSVFEI